MTIGIINMLNLVVAITKFDMLAVALKVFTATCFAIMLLKDNRIRRLLFFVAYFNEIDSFAMGHNLDARALIDGVSLDPRIGAGYNNPSFGYGGYCLPKDTKQLLANYRDLPQTTIRAVVEANEQRKEFIAADIASRNPGVVGIHRLVMKAGSDNFRESSVLGVIERLRARNIEVIVYEPNLDGASVDGCALVNDLSEFINRSDIIVANRNASELDAVQGKVYTRDIFGDN